MTAFQLVLAKAKREEEIPKKFKETHGGARIEESKEEKKSESVLSFK